MLRFDRCERKGTELGGGRGGGGTLAEKVALKHSSRVLEHGTQPHLNKDVGCYEKAFLYEYVPGRSCALVPYGKKIARLNVKMT